MASNRAPSEILVQTLDAFKTQTPELAMMSTDFSDERSRKDQTTRGHIRTLPTIGDYDAASGGYFANANDGQALLTDVDVVLDQHKHVTLNLTHLNAISDDKYNTELGDSAYVLGKAMVDSALAKVTAANLTNTEVVTTANSDFDAINSARKNLVKQGANTRALYGLVNSDFAEVLNADTRVASKDYAGQEATDDALAVWNKVGGFQQIREYADLPANGEDLSALFFDPRAIVITTRLPEDSNELAASLGIPSVAATEVITDPDTGFSLLGILHQQPGTLDIFMTVTSLWGTKVGGTELNASGYRITTA